jgi:hypothetical protein
MHRWRAMPCVPTRSRCCVDWCVRVRRVWWVWLIACVFACTRAVGNLAATRLDIDSVARVDDDTCSVVVDDNTASCRRDNEQHNSCNIDDHRRHDNNVCQQHSIAARARAQTNARAQVGVARGHRWQRRQRKRSHACIASRRSDAVRRCVMSTLKFKISESTERRGDDKPYYKVEWHLSTRIQQVLLKRSRHSKMKERATSELGARWAKPSQRCTRM